MGRNKFNVTLHFLLEVIALIAIGYWGWAQHQGVLRYALAVSLPVIVAVLWATFRVASEADSRPPVVAVPGWVRLLLELISFGFALWGLYKAGAVQVAWGLGLIVIIHYVISYDRVWWLLQN
jgi:hypothetical protein